MRLTTGAIAVVLAGVAAATLGAAAGCSSPPPPPLDPTPTAGPTGPVDAWGRLAALVATDQDRRYTAQYRLTARDRPDRTVAVTVARDGSWLVTIPGSGLGGAADLAVADNSSGLYQCAIGGAAVAEGTSSPDPRPNPTASQGGGASGPPAVPRGCVRAGNPGGELPDAQDPRLERIFTSWLPVLTDREQAIAVNKATFKGVRGECFSVEQNSAALAPPVDVGIYCYDQDGTLTAAALALGKLTLIGDPGPAPATITLPAPVIGGQPLPTASPSAQTAG